MHKIDILHAFGLFKYLEIKKYIGTYFSHFQKKLLMNILEFK